VNYECDGPWGQKLSTKKGGMTKHNVQLPSPPKFSIKMKKIEIKYNKADRWQNAFGHAASQLIFKN
jgi:hypothetical protein